MSDSIEQKLKALIDTIGAGKVPQASYGLTEMLYVEDRGVYQWKVVAPVTGRVMFSGESKTADEAHAAARKIESELGALVDRTRLEIYSSIHQILWSLEVRW
jgi:hypothetical protein